MHPRYEDREYVNTSKKVRRITFTQSPHSYLSSACPIPTVNTFYSIQWRWKRIAHYENTPIQIYRKFHIQKLKIFK